MAFLRGTCTCNRCGTEYETKFDTYMNEFHCPNCVTLYDMINNALWFKESDISTGGSTVFTESIHISNKQISEDDYVTILWLYFHSFSAASISLMYQISESVVRSIILEAKDPTTQRFAKTRDTLLTKYGLDITKPPEKPKPTF